MLLTDVQSQGTNVASTIARGGKITGEAATLIVTCSEDDLVTHPLARSVSCRTRQRDAGFSRSSSKVKSYVVSAITRLVAPKSLFFSGLLFLGALPYLQKWQPLNGHCHFRGDTHPGPK